jgi:hypothetical protein
MNSWLQAPVLGGAEVRIQNRGQALPGHGVRGWRRALRTSRYKGHATAQYVGGAELFENIGTKFTPRFCYVHRILLGFPDRHTCKKIIN